MKKSLIFLLLISLSLFSFSQRYRNKSQIKWLSIAVKAGYGNTIFINSQQFSDENLEYNWTSPSFCFGGRFGLTFGEYFGISFEALNQQVNQEYKLINQVAGDYNKTIKISSLDLFPHLRFTSLTGFYLEAGPKFSFPYKIIHTNSIDRPESQENYEENYNKNLIYISFGLGIMPFRTDKINLSIGIRTNYALKNLYKNANYYPLIDNYYITETNYTNNKTNIFHAQLMFEFNYFFGFWGNSSCNRGRLILFE